MDRSLNLEALREEDDEETWVNAGESETDAGSEDGGIRRGAPNQFDSLCDGVLTTLAVVHAAIGELLELKDDLLQHSLPPNVLNKVALTTTRVFRSVSDMHMPTNELIRLVRLYSTPWEEKSTALKKLHEDYEAKKTQLNIAIKRLQLIDVQSKRIAKERRIMNWERLFAKLTAARGHGRRWKFLIEAFKRKAKEGTEALQEYMHNIDASSDEEEPDEDIITSQMQHANMESPSEEPEENSRKNGMTEGAEDDEDESEDEDQDDIFENDSQESASKVNKTHGDVMTAEMSASPGSRGSEFESVEEAHTPHEVVFLKPPMSDQAVWTHEPQHDFSLHVRVFKPEGLTVRETKCVLTYGDQLHKTCVLDPLPGTPVETSEKPGEKKSGRGGMVGQQGGRVGNQRRQSSISQELKSDKPAEFHEIIFKMPHGLKHPRTGPRAKMDHLRIAVHYGPRDEIVGMTTIDSDDLESLEIPEITYPAPVGDDLIDPNEPVVFADEDDSEEARFSRRFKEFVEDLEPLSFPIYSIDGGRAGSMQDDAAGTLPLMIFWSKEPHPFRLNRMTETHTLRDLIHDLLGVDIHLTSKEDLNKEMQDEALSAVSFTPEPKEPQPQPQQQEFQLIEMEEMVAKSAYDEMMTSHADELTMLQKEYERRLQDLAESLQQMQETHYEREMAFMQAQERALQTQTDPYPPAQSRSRSPSPNPTPVRRPPSVVEPSLPQPTPPKSAKPTETNEESAKPPKRNFKVGKPLPNWGEGLPKDFFERMAAFEEEAWQNRKRLIQRMQREMSDAIEKRLASLHHLSNNEGGVPDALQDVSLPAVFMPQRSNNMLIFNPRAGKYFHPTGSKGTRLTQPPSIVQLPPLPKSKVPVVNLFDLSQNFHRGGPEWLMQRYLQQAAQRGMTPTETAPHQNTPQNLSAESRLPSTPVMMQRDYVPPSKIAEC